MIKEKFNKAPINCKFVWRSSNKKDQVKRGGETSSIRQCNLKIPTSKASWGKGRPRLSREFAIKKVARSKTLLCLIFSSSRLWISGLNHVFFKVNFCIAFIHFLFLLGKKERLITTNILYSLHTFSLLTRKKGENYHNQMN